MTEGKDGGALCSVKLKNPMLHRVKSFVFVLKRWDDASLPILPRAALWAGSGFRNKNKHARRTKSWLGARLSPAVSPGRTPDNFSSDFKVPDNFFSSFFFFFLSWNKIITALMELSLTAMIVYRYHRLPRVSTQTSGFNSAVGRWGQEPGLAVLSLSAECVLPRPLKRQFLTWARPPDYIKIRK